MESIQECIEGLKSLLKNVYLKDQLYYYNKVEIYYEEE